VFVGSAERSPGVVVVHGCFLEVGTAAGPQEIFWLPSQVSFASL
jgi:hypothetical protein